MTMTVQDLIAELECLNPDMPVRLAHDYGDYVHTTAVENIGRIEAVPIYRRNAYGTYNLVDEEDAEECDRLDDVETCVVLFDTTC